MQTLPDHAAPLYQGMVRDLVKIQTVFEKPEGEFDFEHTFDVNKAFKLCDEKKCHIADAYAKLLGVKLEGANDRLKPTYIVDESLLPVEVDELNGCMLISMFSASCTSRDPKIGIPNKMLPWAKWKPMIRYLREKFADTPIRFLGAPNDIIPDELKEFITGDTGAMFGIPQNTLAHIMKHAKLVVTIDNGMSHLTASQEARTFLMYPKCLGTHYILPIGNPNLAWVQMNPIFVNPAQLLFGLKNAIDRKSVAEER